MANYIVFSKAKSANIIVRQLISDTAGIDLVRIREECLKEKMAKAKASKKA